MTRTARHVSPFSYYQDGSKAYMIAPNGLEVGQTVISGGE